MPGTYTEIAYDRHYLEEAKRLVGPGSYSKDDGDFSRKSMNEKASEPGWARAYQLECMSAMPHLLYKEQWEMKKEMVRKLGPGSYNMTDNLQDLEMKVCSTRGICSTLAARFTDMQNDFPGPGTYGKGGIPSAVLEEKEKQSFSTVGMLEAASVAGKIATVGSGLGPGTYNFKSFAEETANKMTGRLGPYKIFTGDRNKPLATGHYAAPKLANLGPGQYKTDSFLDELENRHRKHQGQFGTIAQYPKLPTERIYCSTLAQWPKDPSQPGPIQYNITETSKPESEKRTPFLSTSLRNDKQSMRFFTRNFNPVGVGRYNLQKWDDLQYWNGHSSVFLAKTWKLSMEMEKFMNERIRAKDVRVEDRIFLDTPIEPPRCGIHRCHAQKNSQNFTVMNVA